MKKILFSVLLLSLFQGFLFSQSFRDFEFSLGYGYPVEFISYYKDLIFESSIAVESGKNTGLLIPLIVSSSVSLDMSEQSPLVYILDLNSEETPLSIFQKGLAYLMSFKDKEILTRIEMENFEDFIFSFFDVCGCGYNHLEEDLTFFYEFLTKEQLNKLLSF